MSMSFGLTITEAVLATPPSLLQNVTGATIMALVRRNSGITSTRRIMTILGGTGQPRMVLGQGGLGSLTSQARRLDGDSTVALVTGNGVMVVGAVVHIALVARFNAQLLQLYIDGAQVNSSAPASWTGSTSNTAGSFQIGASPNTANTCGYTMQDVRVYERALSDAEIAQIGSPLMRGRDSNFGGIKGRHQLNDLPNNEPSTNDGVKNSGGGGVNGSPLSSLNPTLYNDLLQVPRRRRRCG